MTAFALVFPGQGSQSVGMLDAWGDHPAVRETLQQASAVLGQDMARLIAEGPKDTLDLTTNTQPVMLTAALACYRAWISETGLRPSVLAGYSLGEYTAWVAAGSLTFEDALPLVRFRAQAMQEAVPPGQGGMAAILGMEADAVREVCAPFHCSLMRPAADRLRQRLEETSFQPPQIPVINNIDVAQPGTASAIRDGLYRQAFGPVRWVETVQALRPLGVRHAFECGPGKVLAGMIKRIDADLATTTILDPATLAEARGMLS